MERCVHREYFRVLCGSTATDCRCLHRHLLCRQKELERTPEAFFKEGNLKLFIRHPEIDRLLSKHVMFRLFFFFCSEMMTDFVTVTLSLVLFLSLLLTVFWKHSTKSVGSVVQCRQGSERSLVINSKLKTSKNDWDRSGLPTKHTLSSSRFVSSFY